MGINLQLPLKSDILKPTITVVGVGGAGGNAVNNMISARLEGVNFVVANTDAQALDHSLCERSIQLGAGITRGLGAGANPDMGRAAAEEAADEIAAAIEGSNMVFITAGMGGGTGTGAAPVVARIAREQNVLTVAVVTKPFQFEGTHRMRLADSGLKELQEYVDTLIIIPNQNLFRIANERTTFADAFKMADEVLHSGVRGVTDLMVKPGLINLDFADIRTVMREMGKAMMGTGEASGERRAVEAAEAAISNPLLDDVSLKGARAALINITGGPDMTLFEVDEAANRIREEVDPEANIIFGSAFNEAMEGRMRVSVVATGIEQAAIKERPQVSPIEQKKPYLFQSRVFEPVKPAARQGAYEPQKQATPASATAQQQEAEPKSSAPFRAHAETQPGAGVESEPAVAASALPSFPPEPAAPEGRAVATAAVHEAPAEPAPLSARTYIAPAPFRPLPESDDAPVRSIFQRISEVRRSLAASRPQESAVRAEASATERAPIAAERASAQVVKKTEPLAEEDQFIDIPAFLRRQAN